MAFFDLDVLGYQSMGRLHVSNDTRAIAHRLCLCHKEAHRKKRVVLAKGVLARPRKEHENRRVVKEQILPVLGVKWLDLLVSGQVRDWA